MILKQYYLGCLAHASYLIGDEQSGVAAVLDPQRDIDQYVEDAKQHNLTIQHVFLSHFHADFLAGHLELRDRCGACIYLGSRTKAEYDFTSMKDGDVLDLGEVRLQVLETPGHSPESICVLVFDLNASADTPHAVLTGDTLFIGDVGRPDLRASLGWTAAELGHLLYESLHQKLLPLPDETLVYPTHGAGSMCGKHLSEETVSTIGVQRQYNYALQPMSADEFVKIVTADQVDAPDYFTYDAVLNTKEHAVLEQSLKSSLKPLTLDDVLSHQQKSHHILDVREAAEYEGAHLAGCLNIGLGGKYATWAGTLLDPETLIVVIAEPGRENEAATRLGRIGYDRVAGYLEGGMGALDPRPDLVAKTERLTAATLDEQMRESSPPLVVDVRNPGEWAEAHIDGSLNLPLNHLRERIQEIPEAGTVVVHCETGFRAAVAASVLEGAGRANIADLVGGIAAWSAAELPTASASDSS